MHPNPVFHTKEAVANLDFARERAFGVLAVAGPDGPLLSHIPFLLDDDGKQLWLHLVRSNPIVRLLKDRQIAKLAVTGPDSYISPDWYGVQDQVPTWNYIAVHLTGTLELRPGEELHSLLQRQSKLFEDRLLPKPPWKTEKMSEGVLERMMRAIVPCRMEITGVDGTWKLNQNKPKDVRHSAADHVAQTGIGSEIDALATLMRGADEDS